MTEQRPEDNNQTPTDESGGVWVDESASGLTDEPGVWVDPPAIDPDRLEAMIRDQNGVTDHLGEVQEPDLGGVPQPGLADPNSHYDEVYHEGPILDSAYGALRGALPDEDPPPPPPEKPDLMPDQVGPLAQSPWTKPDLMPEQVGPLPEYVEEPPQKPDFMPDQVGPLSVDEGPHPIKGEPTGPVEPVPIKGDPSLFDPSQQNPGGIDESSATARPSPPPGYDSTEFSKPMGREEASFLDLNDDVPMWQGGLTDPYLTDPATAVQDVQEDQDDFVEGF